MIRSSGSSVGYRIRERDHGVCAICGYPTYADRVEAMPRINDELPESEIVL